MRTPFALIALLSSVLWLGACDKTPTAPPTPIAESDARAGPAGDPSVPSTESVFPPANTNTAKPTVAGTDGERNPAQESKGLPMPGQNNDHSAPLDTAKRASSP